MVEIVDPDEPMPVPDDITLARATADLIRVSRRGMGHIAIYQPKHDIADAIRVAEVVLDREKNRETVVEVKGNVL